MKLHQCVLVVLTCFNDEQRGNASDISIHMGQSSILIHLGSLSPPEDSAALLTHIAHLAGLFLPVSSFPPQWSVLPDVNMSSWGQQTPVCEKTQLNLPAAAPQLCAHAPYHTHTHTHTHIRAADPVEWDHTPAHLLLTRRGIDLEAAKDISKY